MKQRIQVIDKETSELIHTTVFKIEEIELDDDFITDRPTIEEELEHLQLIKYLDGGRDDYE